MPTINITNQLGADIDIVSAKPETGSLLAKYLPAPEAEFVLHHDLVAALEQPLASAGKTPLSLGFHFSDKLALGGGKPAITIGARETQAVNVNAKTGAKLFGDDNPFGDGITVDAGTAYLSLALNGIIEDFRLTIRASHSGLTPPVGWELNFSSASRSACPSRRSPRLWAK